MSAAPPVQRSPVQFPGKSGRRPWSTLLLREFAVRMFPGEQLLEQVRLGPTRSHLVGVTVTPALEAALRVSNWFADGVLCLPDKTLILEAKIKPNPSAVGQVLFYARLAIRTPIFQSRLSLPIQTAVLFAEADPDVTDFARALGVTVFTYTPMWIADYLQLVQFRARSSPPPEVASPSEPGQGS